GFEITSIIEPTPTEEAIATIPGMAEELRRPMMLLISSKKK
ncbi:MAG: SAM-dependent methyltransferase, partial [Gudongella sp.]|nr:SAM-dependent methyltransferase [Gudongella sp.]MDY0237096.1 SAM-dependent methyltransferase [Gudongella sp.]